MSDTKILSGEQVRNVFRMGSDISMVQVCESHAALELALRQETLVSDRLRLSWREDVATERLRAEAAEAQVKALLEAMPAKRASEIEGNIIFSQRISTTHAMILRDALGAYAAAAKPKER